MEKVIMENIKENIKKELTKLIDEGKDIHDTVLKEKTRSVSILFRYQSWYTKSLNVIKQVIPERYQEFQGYYEIGNTGELNRYNYRIVHYLLGHYYRTGGGSFRNGRDLFLKNLANQVTILASTQDKIDSILTDIKGILQFELFDNELEAAEELLRNGYSRPAGALAGVTLETHLSKVVENHNLKITKTNPSISDYNDGLKKNNVYDIPDWRFIQRLGDIRNLCDHKRTRDPKKEEIRELIDGVKKVIKTIF